MTTYSDPFGGGTIDPAENGYRALDLVDATTLLMWPGYEDEGYVSAAPKIDILSAVPGAVLRLPDARAVSAGIGILFRNLSAELVELQDATGVTIATVATGAARFIFLTSNATEGGAWGSVLYGASAGTLDVGAAAGYGLQANSVQLEVDLPVVSGAATFSVDSTYRAKNFVWTGGTGTATLPAAATVGSGFFFGIRNQGTGVLTVDGNGAEMIDGSANIGLQPQESCYVVCSGSEWYTIGRGRNQQFNFTLLIKNITGGTVTLTPTEAANVVQRYTGVLVANAEIVLPSVVQVYYVSNQTSGAFTVTFKTAGVGTTVSVPSGQNAVLFCDGLNVINNSTTVSGLTALVLSAGAITTPSIAYSGDTSTGLYRPVAGSVGIVGVGTEVMRFTGVALGVNYLQVTNAVAGGSPSIAAVGASANINITLTPKGTGVVNFGGGALGIASGTVGAPGLAFTVEPTTGFYRPAAGTLAVSILGTEIGRWNATGLGIGAPAANSYRLDVGGSATNGPIARFWGSTVQTRGLSISSFANNATNGVAFRFDAPGAGGAQGALAFATNGTDRVFLDEAGNVLINQADAYTTSGFSANLFQVAGVAGESGLTLSAWPGGASSTSPDIQSLKSRGFGVGVRGLVASGDNLLQVVGAGDDGTNFIPAASIAFNVDGTPGANDMPGRITFSTTADGASSVTERMRIDSAGDVGIGTISPVSKLDVVGTVSFNAGTAADPALRPRGDLDTGLFSPSANALGFTTGGTHRWSISAIGTLEPAATSTYSVGSASNEVAQFFGRSFVRDSAGPLTISSINATGSLVFQTGGVLDRFVITANGRLYGTALHNNAGPVTGTTNQYIASGTYTPTLTNVANLAASTAYVCQWIRVGNVVHVSGRVDMDATAGAITQTLLGISLPIASTLAAASDLGGTAASDGIAGSVSTQVGRIFADTVNNRAQLQWYAGELSNRSWAFTFSYVVL